MEISKRKIIIALVMAFLAVSCTMVSVFAATAAGWSVTSVGTSQAYTESVSLAIDNNGVPHVAYCDSSNHIDYASWTGSSWNIQTVATDAQYSGTSGSWVSLALDSNGNPYISYYAFISSTDSYELKYAYLSGGSWTTQVVDPNMAGISNSIALDPSGTPHIAYYSMADTGLMYASPSGSGWTTTQVDTGSCVGISLAFDNAGNPHISYRDGNYLKYASFRGSSWLTPTEIALISQYDGCITSLAFNPTTGNPAISFYNYGSYDLMYVAYSGSAWGTPVTVDSGSGLQVGMWNSLAFNAQRNPAIAYYSTTTSGSPGTLKYATNTGSGWTTQTVDTAVNDGTGNLSPVSLAFTGSGKPTIAYVAGQGSVNTVKVTTEATSFFALPEYAYGALAAVAACFVAVAAFAVVKKRRQQ